MVDDRTALMSARALAPGHEILWYTIDRVLGQGGFGITYLAHDRNLDRAVAIKEYLPTSFAYRDQNHTVKPITSDHGDNFTWGLSSFLKEAQTLARFSHPNIVRVQSVFEENSTAYMVMEYEHGRDLSAVYKESNHLDQSFFEQIFFPIMDGLNEIHKFEFIHRDIKPANIYIREDGTPVLIDFGSARQTTKQQTSEITALVSQGYTPLEQYSPNYGDQGPWTDIYALAATIYEGIVGRKPDESLSRSACLMRSKPDLLEQLDASIYPGCSQRFLNAVFAGLKLEPEGRPQSLEEWHTIYDHGSDEFDPRPAPSGFTALVDSDRTVLQPRSAPVAQPRTTSAQDFDGFDDLEAGGSTRFVDDSDSLADWPSESGEEPFQVERSFSGSQADISGQRSMANTQIHRPSADDLFDFDDDVEADSQRRSPRASATTSSSKRRDDAKGKKQGTGWVFATVAVLGMVGAGVAYYLYDNNAVSTDLSVATLSELPRPSQASVITLPAENARAQLNDMENLASLLAQAYALNASDPALLNTIRVTEASLLSLATKWNATNHVDISNQIRTVSSALPAAVHDSTRIQRILDASNQVSAYAQVMALLDDKRYLQPVDNSVLDIITSVNVDDYQKLKSSTQWDEMMSGFSSIALDKLALSEFDDVAVLTEAALTMDPEDPGFIALRSFLAGS